MSSPRANPLDSASTDVEVKAPVAGSLEALRAEIVTLQNIVRQTAQSNKWTSARAEVAELEITRMRSAVKRLVTYVNEQKLTLRDSGYFKDLTAMISPEETTRTMRILKLSENMLVSEKFG